MKKSRSLQRMISAMLLLAMVICLLPTNVIALPQETAEATAQLNSSFSELTSLREENVKHFSLGNGTYQAVVYGHPVHYQDENGVWQDIDNTLTLQTVNGTQQYANDRVAFAPTYRANAQLMRLQKGDYSISMSLISNASASTMSTTNISSSSAAVTNANKQITSIDQAMNASWSSNVKYENVLTNVDLEYIVDYDYVKENIIVKAPRASYDFAFRLNLDGMYATLLSDGSVGIYSNETNAMEYAIPTPYMYDARGRFSDEVTYSLAGASGKYVLTVSADEAWMEENDRAFPVTIDPTYTTTRVSLDHTYTATYSPSTPQVSPSVLWVSADETTYIKPTENITIPSDMVLISATLDTYYFFDDPYITDVIPVGAYEMLYEWDEDTATYNTMSAYPNRGKSTTLYDYELCVAGTTATVSNPRKASFNVTEVMAGWLNGEDQNGIVLDYYGYDPNVSEWYVGFHSIFAQYAYRPMFTYKYHTSGTEYIEYIYRNYYDSSFAAHVNLINEAVVASNAAFSRQFDINFTTNYAPVCNSNFIDACPDINANDPCKCGNSPHHTDAHYIENELYELSRAENEIIVMWTDRPDTVYCTHSNGSCQLYNYFTGAYAFVHDNHPVISVLNIVPDDADDFYYEACMGILLIHETAHTFGKGESYDSGTGSNAHDLINGWHCVMEHYECEEDADLVALKSFYTGVKRGTTDAFCESCRNELDDEIYLGLYDNR